MLHGRHTEVLLTPLEFLVLWAGSHTAAGGCPVVLGCTLCSVAAQFVAALYSRLVNDQVAGLAGVFVDAVHSSWWQPQTLFASCCQVFVLGAVLLAVMSAAMSGMAL